MTKTKTIKTWICINTENTMNVNITTQQYISAFPQTDFTNVSYVRWHIKKPQKRLKVPYYAKCAFQRMCTKNTQFWKAALCDTTGSTDTSPRLETTPISTGWPCFVPFQTSLVHQSISFSKKPSIFEEGCQQRVKYDVFWSKVIMRGCLHW